MQLSHLSPAECESVSDCLSLTPLNDLDIQRKLMSGVNHRLLLAATLKKSFLSCIQPGPLPVPTLPHTQKHTQAQTLIRTFRIYGMFPFLQ